MIILLIIGVLLGAAAVIFALQNVVTITVLFLTWQITGSLSLILILAITTGIVISLLISIPEVIITSWAMSRLKKENHTLQQQIESLKFHQRGVIPEHTTVVKEETTQSVTSSNNPIV